MRLHKNNSGVTLVELVVVMAIIGIIAVIGVPQYGQYIAKSKARKASNDLFQNMRLARTMSIKENVPYMIVFNPVTNTYNIGSDVNQDGDIADVGTDGYGTTGAVRVVDIETENGNTVVFDTSNFTAGTIPPSGPLGVGIANAASFTFNSDGTAGPPGIVYFQEINGGYAYCVELVNVTGKIDLFAWQGSVDDASNINWVEIR